MTPPLVAYIDVDDTLVRSFGSKRIPMSEVIRHIRALHEAGFVLYCWSSGGALYAERSAQELGLSDCFVAYLPKPNVLVDDMKVESWPSFIQVHPNEAVSKTAHDYEAALQRGPITTVR